MITWTAAPATTSLEGGYGADMLTGGDHDTSSDGKGDTASYSMSMMGVTVRLHSAVQAMGGDAEGDTFAGIGRSCRVYRQ